jgi:hypothetical protein
MIGSRPYPSRDGSALRGIAFSACRFAAEIQARHQRNHSFAALLGLSNLPQLALIGTRPSRPGRAMPVPCFGRIFIVISWAQEDQEWLGSGRSGRSLRAATPRRLEPTLTDKGY